MEVKKIRASTMREALFQVKKELGADAVIIKTKTDHTLGVFGLGAKKFVEIVACKDSRFIGVRGLADYNKAVLDGYYNSGQQANKGIEAGMHKVLNKYQTDEGISKLKEDVSCIKTALESITHYVKHSKRDLPEDLEHIYSFLIEQEIANELAEELVHKIKNELSPQEKRDKTLIQQHLRKHIATAVKTCEPIKLKQGKCTKVALIGPTGVGKTTTIAKLAADFSLVQKKRVSVITIDTYRIAAVEQIKTYMQILNIPLEVVTTPEDMQEAIKRQKNSDIILIDTAGRSQKNSEQIEELRTFIEAAGCDEVHLVLSTTTNYKNTLDIINRFSLIPINKILFTKLDEAVNFGLIISVIAKMDKALSYMTRGQSVPDDIEEADSGKISQMVLEGVFS